MRSLVVVLALIAAVHVSGKDIDFWKKPSVTNVTILKIEDGILTYELGGQAYQERLMNVKAIRESTATDAVDEDSAEAAMGSAGRLLSARDMDDGRDSGKAIGVRMRPGRGRIYEPLLRIYVLQEDERGAREVVQYQNIRGVRDPSRLDGVDSIDTATYRQRWFFFPVERLVAWRAELWFEGELIDTSAGAEEHAPKNWWRLADKVHSANLREVESPEKKEAAEAAKIDFAITRTRLLPQMGDETKVVFTMEYSMTGKADRMPEPKITFHYVVEDESGRYRVRSETCGEKKTGGMNVSSGFGKSKLAEELSTKPTRNDLVNPLNGIARRECEARLPNTVTFTSARSSLAKAESGNGKLVYWRVTIEYEDEVVASEEAKDERLRAALPKNWWK